MRTAVLDDRETRQSEKGTHERKPQGDRKLPALQLSRRKAQRSQSTCRKIR